MSDANAVPAKWDATKITSQTGKQVIVTGANSGIGFVTALELARHGADVVLACRNETKGREAVTKIEEELKLSPQAGKVEFRELDVSSLASVKTFADAFKADHDRIDLLINNAGIMAVPHALSVDGYESQFATNHLGHFALTAQLLKLLKNSKHARIVNVSSNAHKRANVDLNEIMTPKEKYTEFGVYSNTKMYNLLFSLELNRRLRAANIENVIATTAHPGFTATNLGDSLFANSNWFLRQILKVVWMLPIVQTSEFGALPTLYAAVGENIQRDDYIGPKGFQSFTGYPVKEQPINVSRSEEHAKKLWGESEKLAKLKFDI